MPKRLLFRSVQVFRHKWQANDFVVWSNRRIIHTATANSAFSGQHMSLIVLIVQSLKTI